MPRLYPPQTYDPVTDPGNFWASTVAPVAAPPPLEGDAATEVAIVGAGYTGLSAALHLAMDHGIGVTVLDAAQPGWGASGRNGGFACLGSTKLSYKAIISRFGLADAQAFFKTQCASIDTVARLLDTHAISADTRSGGEWQLAHRPRHYKSLRDEAGLLMDAFGQATRLLERQALAAEGISGPGFHAALQTPRGFALNPLKYATGLARSVADAGVTLHGRSPVTAITRENDRYRLTTPRGALTARRLILATNGYSTDGIPSWLTGRYLPALSNIIVTRPLSATEQAAQGWTTNAMAYDTRHLLHYFRLLPDGRFLFGMRGNTNDRPVDRAAMHRAIRRHFDRMFPAWAHVETPHFWSGLICASRDLLPYVGPVGDWPNAFTSLAYHGNGVAMASHAGKLLAGLITGAPVAIPAPMRAPLRRLPFAPLQRHYLKAAYTWYGLLDL